MWLWRSCWTWRVTTGPPSYRWRESASTPPLTGKLTKYIYLEYHKCPNWDSPLPQATVPPPPTEPKGVGTHPPAGEGVGGSQFGRLEKKPCTLSTLWVSLSNPKMYSKRKIWGVSSVKRSTLCGAVWGGGGDYIDILAVMCIRYRTVPRYTGTGTVLCEYHS